MKTMLAFLSILSTSVSSTLKAKKNIQSSKDKTADGPVEGTLVCLSVCVFTPLEIIISMSDKKPGDL